jgi:hypothetical protein
MNPAVCFNQQGLVLARCFIRPRARYMFPGPCRSPKAGYNFVDEIVESVPACQVRGIMFTFFPPYHPLVGKFTTFIVANTRLSNMFMFR